jgi:hypothetical protein
MYGHDRELVETLDTAAEPIWRVAGGGMWG